MFLANTKDSERLLAFTCAKTAFICKTFFRRNTDANVNTLALDRLPIFVAHAPSGIILIFNSKEQALKISFILNN